MAKLTKAQMDLLVEAYTRGPWGVSCVDSYKPRQKLIELGLVKEHGSSAIILTDQGLTFLQEMDAELYP